MFGRNFVNMYKSLLKSEGLALAVADGSNSWQAPSTNCCKRTIGNFPKYEALRVSNAWSFFWYFTGAPLSLLESLELEEELGAPLALARGVEAPAGATSPTMDCDCTKLAFPTVCGGCAEPKALDTLGRPPQH